MRNLLKWPWLFWQICWNEGVHKALLLALGALTAGGPWAYLVALFLDKFPSARYGASSADTRGLLRQPLISVIVPVGGLRRLPPAAQSVLSQRYPQVELILAAPNALAEGALPAALQAQLRQDSRVLIIPSNHSAGISAVLNAAVAASRGAYVGWMNADDLLHPDALAILVRRLNQDLAIDIYYTDEVIINARRAVVGYLPKGRVAMDLMLACNAVRHGFFIRKAAFQNLGGLKSEFDGAQDHDLILRALEQGLRFDYLPCALYGWRAESRSLVRDPQVFDLGPALAYPRAYPAGRKVIQAALARQRVAATVMDGRFGWYRVKYQLPERRDEVAMIVPFKDRVDCLRRLLASLEQTAYPDYRVVLVNNRSERPETLEFLAELQRRPSGRYHVVDFNEPFNYSRIYNQAVTGVSNEILLFMNNDLEVIHPEWLEAMLEHIYRPGVGAVGCRLILKNGALQHGGMVFKPSVYFCAMNLFYDDGYYTRVQRQVSGVTAACLMIRRSVFLRVGGFDELQFPVGFSDADLCLKLDQAGEKIIYTPYAELRHHESASRKVQEENYEKMTLFQRYIGSTPLADRHYPLR